MKQVFGRIVLVLALVFWASPALAQTADEMVPSPEALDLLEAMLDPTGTLESASCDDILLAVPKAITENPELAPDVVFAAIQACPNQAEDIIAAAVEAAPDQAEAIFTAALEADPAAAGPAAAALARVIQLPNFPQAALRAPVFRSLPPSPSLP